LSEETGKLSKKKPRASKKRRFEVDCTLVYFINMILGRYRLSTNGDIPIASGRSSDSRSSYSLHLPNTNVSGYSQISSRLQRRDRGWISQPSLLFPERKKLCFQETWMRQYRL